MGKDADTRWGLGTTTVSALGKARITSLLLESAFWAVVGACENHILLSSGAEKIAIPSLR